MSADNVIPFRNRPPSEEAVDMYRTITRLWSPEVRKIMFPDHYQADRRKQTDKKP